MAALMPNITLKDIPRDLHRSVKSRAKAYYRSLNKEVIATLQAVTTAFRLFLARPMIVNWSRSHTNAAFA
jgi:plasmid stability protein